MQPTELSRTPRNIQKIYKTKKTVHNAEIDILKTLLPFELWSHPQKFTLFEKYIENVDFLGFVAIFRPLCSGMSVIYVQGVLDYRDLDYRNPRNTGINKIFHL